MPVLCNKVQKKDGKMFGGLVRSIIFDKKKHTMTTLYYPESATKTAVIDAFRSSATIEVKSCTTDYGQARCIDGYDADGNHIVRNIICDASYFNAPNFDRGI